MTKRENQPLLSATDSGANQDDDILNDAAIPQNVHACDPRDNPLEWPPSFKWAIIALLSFMAFNVTLACLSIMPSAHHIIRDLSHGAPNQVASVLLVTLWELGEAAGPLVIAPLSEAFGRYAVLNTSNALFLAANVLAALSADVPSLIAARALTGLAVASNVLNPAIVGDMLAPEQRGRAMAVITIAPMIASAVGPAIGGAVADGLGWRQVIWINVALACVCQLPLFAVLKETYREPLHQSSGTMQRDPGSQSSVSATAAQATHRNAVLRSFWGCATRPASILCSSKVLVLLCMCHSLDFVFYYVMVTTLPDVLQHVYSQSLSTTGLTFIYFTIGSTAGLIFCNVAVDRLYKKLRNRNQGLARPEYRLPLAIVGAFGVPAAMMLYGWTAYLQLPLLYLRLSLLLLGVFICFSGMSVYTYVIDAFGAYSASAMAGVIVTRSVMGAFVPLLTVPLLARLGYGYGFTVLSLTSLSLAPIPIVVMKYGAKWRQSSEYTREMTQCILDQDFL